MNRDRARVKIAASRNSRIMRKWCRCIDREKYRIILRIGRKSEGRKFITKSEKNSTFSIYKTEALF